MSLARYRLLIVLGLCCWTYPVAGLVHASSLSDSHKRPVERAAELFKSGDADGAIALLNKATELNPSNAEAYYLLGRVYFHGKKKPHEATDALLQALKLRPAYSDALNDLAEVYLAQGKSAEAEQTLKRAIEADPRHDDSYEDLAKLYESRRDVAAAAKIYQSLLAFRPAHPDALFGLAMLQEGQGENKAAHDL